MLGLDNPIHVLFLLAILLLLFGAKRLPEIGRSLGTGMREFKDSVSGKETHTELPAAPQEPAEPTQERIAELEAEVEQLRSRENEPV